MRDVVVVHANTDEEENYRVVKVTERSSSRPKQLPEARLGLGSLIPCSPVHSSVRMRGTECQMEMSTVKVVEITHSCPQHPKQA